MIPGDNLGMGESQSDSATRSEKRLRTNLRFLEAMSAMNNYEIDVDPNNMVSYSGLAVGARVASRTVDRATDRGADEVSGRYIPLHPRETRKSMWNKRLETMWGTGRINRGSGPKPKANINVSKLFSSYTYFFVVFWLRKFEGSLSRCDVVVGGGLLSLRAQINVQFARTLTHILAGSGKAVMQNGSDEL